MAEFDIQSFATRIRDTLYDNFPYENEDINQQKHKNRNKHVRDVALKNNAIVTQDNKVVFDIGNNYAESEYPYYHILQDAEVIRIRGKGTTKSRGSQAKIEKLSSRDYGIVSWNGKTYSKEYAKNVRGKRSLYDKSRRYAVGTDGKTYVINKNANYYANKHYRFIDRILDQTMTFIGQDFGLKLKRKVDTGLQEEYNASNKTSTTPLSIENILDIFGSYEESGEEE